MSSDSGRVWTAAVGDAGEVARLLDDFNTEFGDPTPGVVALATRARELIETGELTALLAARPPVGIAVLRFRPALWSDGLEAYLEELYVAPERRGEGLGRELLQTAMKLARERGASRIDLGTAISDTAARSLYESCGFTNLEREGDPESRMLFYERELEAPSGG